MSPSRRPTPAIPIRCSCPISGPTRASRTAPGISVFPNDFLAMARHRAAGPSPQGATASVTIYKYNGTPGSIVETGPTSKGPQSVLPRPSLPLTQDRNS